MQLTLYEQTCIFLWSFVLGGIIAGIYTIMAVLRTLSPPGKWLLFFTDILFMLAAAFLNFLFALSCTQGMIRGYSLAAQLIAFCVLYLTVGRFIKRSSFVIADFLHRTWHKVTSPVVSFSVRVFREIAKKCKKLLKKTKKNKISLEK
ncbi:MAG: spore cortex biosynthesis protein YabQ [Clostridia bacterium]|nr:spore cortex biosynthesis protein YabQ [Clostridia bacterium]